MVNPDLNLQQSTLRSNLFNSFIKQSVAIPINITLRGRWSFVTKDSGISIITKTDTTTDIKFVTRYSLPFDAVLKRDSSVLLNIKSISNSPVSMPSNNVESIKIYPNPVPNNANIYVHYNSVQEGKNVHIEIVGEDGKRIYSNHFKATKGDKEIIVSCSKIGKGWKIVKVFRENTTPLVTKFLVR